MGGEAPREQRTAVGAARPRERLDFDLLAGEVEHQPAAASRWLACQPGGKARHVTGREAARRCERIAALVDMTGQQAMLVDP